MNQIEKRRFVKQRLLAVTRTSGMSIEKAINLKFQLKKFKNFKVLSFSIYISRKLTFLRCFFSDNTHRKKLINFLKMLAVSSYTPQIFFKKPALSSYILKNKIFKVLCL